MSRAPSTDRNDMLNASNWNDAWDSFYMYGGNDTVNTQVPGVSYLFYGGNGNDRFFGNASNDYAIGGIGNDYLNGRSGDDLLDGQDNNDILKGGDGDDVIIGNTEKDILYGGRGVDTFIYNSSRSDSGIRSSTADIIADWNARDDVLQFQFEGGTSSNYAEHATNAGNIETAVRQAESAHSLTDKKYVFLYNHAKDRGYLLVDLQDHGQFTCGIVLKGAGSAHDMDWSLIVG